MQPDAFRLRHHAALERILLFDYALTCRTGLHIGAGKTPDLVGSDLPILRDAGGRPLVPGSSLRGVLRSGVEALCRSLALDRALASTPPAAPGAPPEVLAGWRKMDIVDRLFGRVAQQKGDFSYGSRLQISDARATADVQVELRDGVGISRETRTAAGGVKFDLEVIPAGTRFQGSVRFKNPSDYEVGLVAQAFWMLDAGVLLLGGKGARGLGWVQVEVSSPTVLEAADILARRGGATAQGFVPIEDAFASYLSELEELRQAAASASPGAERA